jgi:hypothetical protein
MGTLIRGQQTRIFSDQAILAAEVLDPTRDKDLSLLFFLVAQTPGQSC